MQGVIHTTNSRPRIIIFWTNDDTTFTIHVRDTNGTVDTIIVDGTAEGLALLDTLVPGGADTNVTFTFPIADTRTYDLAITLIDNDGITTTTPYPILVRKGQPRVWVEGDTLFVPVASGGGDIAIGVNSIDTNGTFQTFYWDFNSPFDTNVTVDKQTIAPSYSYNVVAPLVNTPFEMAVFGKDDDGLMAGDTFWLYPDGPPDSTAITLPGQDTSYVAKDPVTIQWTGLDEHDGLSTEFAVMIDYPGGADQYDTLQSFQPATAYKQGDVFEYVFTPAAGGTYKIRILARDRSNNTVLGRKREFGYPF